MKNLDYSNRIKCILKELNLTQAALASKMGVSQGIISEFSSGSREPSKDFMFGLSKMGVSIDWFLTGEGTPFVKQGIGASAGYTPPGVTTIGAAGAWSGIAPPHAPAPAHFKIPLLKQQVSCGPGINWEAEENVDEYIEVQTFIPQLGIGRVFAVKAQGSSMLGAGIHGGDYIFFDGSAEQTPQDGIYVFALDGDVFCKRLEFDKLSRKIKIFSVRVADLEKAELLTALDTTDTSFADRFYIFGKVTRCIRLVNIGEE
jgi:SOS-response transcriptional repressor LexA